MRVSWVHPSWRDLVIEHLASDEAARRHFLRGCSINGVLLALSVAGGTGGRREAPLLATDTDWDALTDRLHDLVPELEPTELIGLLDGLGLAIDRAGAGRARLEAEALAATVLTRVASGWNRSGTAIPGSSLEAWLTLAAQLPRRPPTPVLTLTWAELLPSQAPLLLDPVALERFADWLELVDLLMTRDRHRLAELGFPGQATPICEAFLTEVTTRTDDLDARAIAAVTRSLQLIARVSGALADAARALSRPLLESEPLSRGDRLGPESADPAVSTIDVDRVLSDL